VPNNKNIPVVVKKRRNLQWQWPLISNVRIAAGMTSPVTEGYNNISRGIKRATNKFYVH
jgi:hypothetical protein